MFPFPSLILYKEKKKPSILFLTVFTFTTAGHKIYKQDLSSDKGAQKHRASAGQAKEILESYTDNGKDCHLRKLHSTREESSAETRWGFRIPE